MTAAETTDPVLLALTLVDIPSVSGDEGVIADLVEATLGACPYLEVLRDGDAVVARTRSARPGRPKGESRCVGLASRRAGRHSRRDGEGEASRSPGAAGVGRRALPGVD